MKFTIATTAALFGMTLAQGVTQRLTPTGAAPAGCTGTFSGNFEVSVQMVKKRSVEELAPAVQKRAACGGPGTLVLSLSNGVLRDATNRVGYIAANRQFQFDAPVQAGAIFTAGWSVCSDNNLALGSSKTFYQCLSGNFYNLYDQTQGGQCQAINIMAIPCQGTAAASMPAATSQPAMSMPAAGSTMQRMTQIGDGQIQAPTGRVTQITDGQIQAPTSVARVTQITDGQIQVSSARPATSAPRVTQITDGQIQVSSARPATSAPRVTQITDGQIQVSSARPVTSAPRVTQITDGQIQVSSARAVTSAARVTQITDGQIQVSSARAVTSAARVTQITDGQIQVSSARAVTSAARVTQITDGQIQASSARAATPTPSRVVVAEAPNAKSLSLGSLVLGLAVALFGF